MNTDKATTGPHDPINCPANQPTPYGKCPTCGFATIYDGSKEAEFLSGGDNEDAKAIINAALAAERERGQQGRNDYITKLREALGLIIGQPLIESAQQLREQLAAEREENVRLMNRLAAERERGGKQEQWTAEKVKRYYFGGGGDEVLANDINAELDAAVREAILNDVGEEGSEYIVRLENQLAAERDENWRNAYDNLLIDYTNLKEQLAAEQNHYDLNLSVWEKDNQQLTEQLAAAQAATVDAFREGWMRACVFYVDIDAEMPEHDCSKQLAMRLADFKPDTTALDAAIAAAQQPLVDALKTIQSWINKSESTSVWSADLRIVINAALASTQCCERDHNHDGNCDRHSAPGVLRVRQ